MRVKLVEGRLQGLDSSKDYLVEDIFPDGQITIRIYGRAGISKRYVFKKDEYTVCECTHTITKEDVCVECGELIFATETRPCSECGCFYEHIGVGWSSCGKKLMTVTHNMKVYYPIKEGSCFESKEGH